MCGLRRPASTPSRVATAPRQCWRAASRRSLTRCACGWRRRRWRATRRRSCACSRRRSSVSRFRSPFGRLQSNWLTRMTPRYCWTEQWSAAPTRLTCGLRSRAWRRTRTPRRCSTERARRCPPSSRSGSRLRSWKRPTATPTWRKRLCRARSRLSKPPAWSSAATSGLALRSRRRRRAWWSCAERSCATLRSTGWRTWTGRRRWWATPRSSSERATWRSAARCMPSCWRPSLARIRCGGRRRSWRWRTAHRSRWRHC
mmetsp:Transcript_42986/g.129038  ORF Transcript_42986/g.129038 Transcript_42986/m.129038 type:complete len:257 (-) Transcript_42986:582-1352(-)